MSMTKTDMGLIYPEPRLAVRPWADYGDEDRSTSFCLDAWTVRERVVDAIRDGRLSPDVDFGVASTRARRDPGPTGPTERKYPPQSSRLPAPRFLCFECGAQFENDPDPQYGDCPRCSHAGAVGLADSEEG